jgi:hypothetical protein
MSNNHPMIFAEQGYVKQLPERLEEDFSLHRRIPAGQENYPELIFVLLFRGSDKPILGEYSEIEKIYNTVRTETRCQVGFNIPVR